MLYSSDVMEGLKDVLRAVSDGENIVRNIRYSLDFFKRYVSNVQGKLTLLSDSQTNGEFLTHHFICRALQGAVKQQS